MSEDRPPNEVTMPPLVEKDPERFARHAIEHETVTSPNDETREMPSPLRLAQIFHEAYERLAPSFGYETREATRAFDPASPNGRLMIAVCGEVAARLAAPRVPEEISRPRIVCLCGSTRFYEAFQQANYDETMAGHIVLSVGFYPHAKAQHGHGEGVGHDSAEKIALDELHKRKIDLADEVFVLNVGGYIGESTRSEIEYAEARGKPVRYCEPGLASGEKP